MNQQKYYVPEIQGLRALAVLAVVLYHAEINLFSGGYIGVDVFFVISGYLITGLMLREYDRHSKFNLIDFFARRLKRLLPASFFVTIVTMLSFSSFFSAYEVKMLTSSAIASLVYLSNIWFATISTNYLQGSADTDPFLHMWSLAVEEQFYLFWPLLIIAAYKIARNRVRFWPTILIVVFLSFLLNVLLIKSLQPWAFFSAPTRAWEFGLGALVSVLVWKKSINLNYATSWVGVIIGLVALGYALFTFDQLTLFPGNNALYPVIGTALIILCICTGQPTPLSFLFASRPALLLGNISYSWYLWHWPAKVFAKEAFPDIAELAVFISVFISFLLAVFTTRFIEDPIRKIVNITNGRVYLVTIVCTVLTLALFGFIRNQANTVAQQPLQKSFLNAQNDLARLYELGCQVNFFDTSATGCHFGNAYSSDFIVLFGDSHAAHWFAAVEHFAIKNNLHLITHTKNACPSYEMTPHIAKLGRSYNECREWRANVYRQIERNQPKLVVMSNFVGYAQSGVSAAKSGESLSEAYRQTFSEIPVPVVVINPTGAAPFSIPTCLARSNRNSLENASDCDFEFQENEILAQAEQRTVAEFDHVFLVDLNDVICPNGVCPAMTGNRINYIDSLHMSNELSKSLAKPLSDELEKLKLFE